MTLNVLYFSSTLMVGNGVGDGSDATGAACAAFVDGAVGASVDVLVGMVVGLRVGVIVGVDVGVGVSVIVGVDVGASCANLVGPVVAVRTRVGAGVSGVEHAVAAKSPQYAVSSKQ